MTQATPPLRTTYQATTTVKPGAKVWTQPMPTSVEDQVRFFHENGFLILKGVLSKSDLAEMDREITRLAEEHATLPRIREGFDLEPNQDPNRKTPTFRKIGGICEICESFGKLMRHPKIVNMLHEIMGPSVELWRDVLMLKPARVGREKPWHQDSSYWPWEPMELVSAMTAIDDASAENGCMQVIPGTHKKLVQHYGKELQVDIDGELQAQTTYVPLNAGDTLLFHSLLLHGSETNRSDRDRRVCIVSYMPSNLKYVREDKRPDPIIVSKRE